MPEKYIDGLHHPSYQYGRANKNVAKGILSRVYFRLGEHEKALAVVNDVIEKADALYALDQDPIEAWNRSNASKGNE